MREDFEGFGLFIILPSDHPLVTTIIIEKHNDSLRFGDIKLMAVSKEKY